MEGSWKIKGAEKQKKGQLKKEKIERKTETRVSLESSKVV